MTVAGRLVKPAWGWALGALLLGLALATLPLLWAGALLGATAVFLLSLIQPLFALGLMLLLAPWGAYEARALTGSPLDSGQVLFFFTLALWLARGLRQKRIVLRHTPLAVPLLLFLYVALITLLESASLAAGLRQAAKWVEMLLLIWLTLDLTADLPPKRAPWVILALLLLAGVSQGVFGIYQFFWRGEAPPHFMVLGRFYRAFGSFDQPNPFGGYMNLTALPALGALIGVAIADLRARIVACGVWRVVRRPPFTVYHFSLAIAAAISIAGVLVSWSRGAWLGLTAGAVALVFFLPRRWWQGVGLLLATAVIAGGLLLAGMALNRLPAGVVARITSGFTQDLRFDDVRGVDITHENFAVVERLAHWQAAVGMAQDYFWLGVGFGNYEAAYPAYRLINWPAALGHAHNYYLNLWAEVGLIGLLAYLLFWTAVFWQNIRLLQRADWPQRGIVLGLLAAFMALSIHHLVDNLYVNNIYLHLGVMLGLQQLLWESV